MLGFAPLADNSIAGFGNVPVDVVVTGIAATGAVTSVTIEGIANVSPIGIPATGAVGTVTIDNKNIFSVTGVSATGAVGSVNVWDLITPSQSSGFSAITPSQSPNWEEIAA